MDFSELFILIGKTLFSYFFLMVILKIMGKRELSQISMFDVVIFLIMSELFSLSLLAKYTNLLLKFSAFVMSKRYCATITISMITKHLVE